MAKKAARKKKAKAESISDRIEKDSTKVFDYLELASVRLIDLQAKLNIPSGKAVPPKSKIESTVSVGVAPDQPNVLVDAYLQVGSEPEFGDASTLTIQIHLQCVYAIKGARADELKNGGSALATTGMLIMWPHFRELVQSLTSRMGLLPVTLPMFLAKPTAGSNALAFDRSADSE